MEKSRGCGGRSSERFRTLLACYLSTPRARHKPPSLGLSLPLAAAAGSRASPAPPASRNSAAAPRTAHPRTRPTAIPVLSRESPVGAPQLAQRAAMAFRPPGSARLRPPTCHPPQHANTPHTPLPGQMPGPAAIERCCAIPLAAAAPPSPAPCQPRRPAPPCYPQGDDAAPPATPTPAPGLARQAEPEHGDDAHEISVVVLVLVGRPLHRVHAVCLRVVVAGCWSATGCWSAVVVVAVLAPAVAVEAVGDPVREVIHSVRGRLATAGVSRCP